MRIAICDNAKKDQILVLDLIKHYASKHTEGQLDCDVYSSGEDLLDAVRKNGGFDIYLLDVCMPLMDGIELGRHLRKTDRLGKIIYLTATADRALDAYRVNAMQYLLKPLSEEELFPVLDEAIAMLSGERGKYFLVRTPERTVRIAYDNLLFAELCTRNIAYHLADGSRVDSVTIRTSFAEAVHGLIHDSRFYLAGTSMLVNMDHLTAIEKETLVFRKQYRAYPSKKVCAEVHAHWLEHWFTENV